MNLQISSPRKHPEQGQWTYKDWAKLPDDGYRYEVLNGELHMSPPPSFEHQNASLNLASLLHAFVKKHGLGRVVTAPVGVRLPGQEVPVQPDIVFVRKRRQRIIKEYVEGAPDLIVEILSPSNWIYDREEKFQAYQKTGVPEYWIVDCRAKTVEAYVLQNRVFVLKGRFGRGQTVSAVVIPGFSIDVAEVFAA
jgi:Uma2 family endonuclease